MHPNIVAFVVAAIFGFIPACAEESLIDSAYQSLNLNLDEKLGRRTACSAPDLQELYLTNENCLAFVIDSDVTVCGDLNIDHYLSVGSGFSPESIFDETEIMARKDCVVHLDNKAIRSLNASVPVIIIGDLDVKGKASVTAITAMTAATVTIGAEGSLDDCPLSSNEDEEVSLNVTETIEILSGASVSVRNKLKASRAILDDGSSLVTECGSISIHRDADDASGMIISDASLAIVNSSTPEFVNLFSQLVLINAGQLVLKGDTDVTSLTQLDNGSYLKSEASLFSPIIIIDDASGLHVDSAIQAPVLLNAIDGGEVLIGGNLDGGLVQVYDGATMKVGLGVVALSNFVVESGYADIGHDLVVGEKVYVHNGGLVSIDGDLKITSGLQMSSSQLSTTGDLVTNGNIVISATSTLSVQGNLSCAGRTQKDIDEYNAQMELEKQALEISASKSPEDRVESANTDQRRLQDGAFMTKNFDPSSIIEDMPVAASAESPNTEDVEQETPVELVPTPGIYCGHSIVIVGDELDVTNSWLEAKQCDLTVGSDLKVGLENGLINMYQGTAANIGGDIEGGAALLVSKNSHLTCPGEIHASMSQVSHNSDVTVEELKIDLDLQISNNSRIKTGQPLLLIQLTSILINFRSSLFVPGIIRTDDIIKLGTNNQQGQAGAIFVTGRSQLEVGSGGIDFDDEATSSLVIQDGSLLITEGSIVFARKIKKTDSIADTQSVLRVENRAEVAMLDPNQSTITCYKTKEAVIRSGVENDDSVCDQKKSITLNQVIPSTIQERLKPSSTKTTLADDAWDRYSNELE